MCIVLTIPGTLGVFPESVLTVNYSSGFNIT